MAKKLAIFVEGHTELHFIERLLLQFVGTHQVVLHVLKLFRDQPRVAEWERQATFIGTGPERLVRLTCSGTYSRVVSDIRENHQRLQGEGFNVVLGVRDVHPEARVDIPAIHAAMAKVLPQDLPKPSVVLAEMEVEAWIVLERTHFAKVAPALTRQAIQAKTNFDIEKDDPANLPQPSAFLDSAYQIAGKHYSKKAKPNTEILEKLDWAELYVRHRKYQGVREVLDAIEWFVS